MTTAVCLAILATAAIINTIHGNENQALVIQCIIFAVYNIALNFALNNIRIGLHENHAGVKLPWGCANNRPIKAPFINQDLLAITTKGGYLIGKKGNDKPRYPRIPYVKDRWANEQD